MIYGELAGLSCALAWAGASNLFSISVKVYTPLQLNFVKCAISAGILFTIMFLFYDTFLPEAEARLYFYLLASGVCGIAIGDTLYFQALEVLGPKTTILMETLAPPFTGILAFAYYGTTISFIGWVGIMFVVFGISFVVKEQQQELGDNQPKDVENLPSMDIPLMTKTEINEQSQQAVKEDQQELQQILSNKKLKGVISGVFCMLFHSFGMILSHDALSTNAFDPVTSTFLRLTAGSVFLAVIVFFKKSETFKIPKQTRRENMILGLGILLGPLLCIWLQQLSLMYTRPEIAQTLIGTTPIFAICISVWQGQKVSKRYVTGSLFALIGVVLIVLKR